MSTGLTNSCPPKKTRVATALDALRPPLEECVLIIGGGFEALLSNRGDCEDYAILKYAALLEAGIPKDDVKIVILQRKMSSQAKIMLRSRLASMVSG
jgi:hypothetical protein